MRAHVRRRRNRAPTFSVVLLSLAVGACAAGRPPPGSVEPGWTETGEASWYGPGFHGRLTASGEVYDMEAATAAHPWLPFGTSIGVENLDNGRSARARVNDRGPFARGRILDVSRAVARELGMLRSGTARVRISILELPPEACRELQVGAFRERGNAERLRRRLARRGLAARREASPDGLVRVVAGPFRDARAARDARERYGGFVRPCARET